MNSRWMGITMQQTLQLLHEIVWGPWTIFLFLWTGLFFTVRSGGFQVRGLSYWWKKTVGSLWQSGVRTEKQRESAADEDRRRAASDKITVSAFQTSCTALAATIGTGNIVGVATALTAGGPGAVFWLWISALIGMATAYAETSLGQKYRYRGPDGTWQCGPMAVMERGLGCRSMGLLYAFFAVLASLGMGSMVQANAVSETLRYEAGMKPETAAVLVTALTAAVVWGGIRRISRMTSWFVPLSAGIYFFFSVWVLVMCRRSIPVVLLQIIKEAWTPGAAGGGIAGFLFSRSVRFGLARGVFSNEAGLGTLAVLHGAAEDTTPEEQGMWAMFEVFFDTIVICSCTAFILLLVPEELTRGLMGMELLQTAMNYHLGSFGVIFVAVILALFSFSTFLGILFYARSNVSYLFGNRWLWQTLYKILALIMLFIGGIQAYTVVWDLGDVGIGLMTIFNLAVLFPLSNEALSALAEYEKKKKYE